MAGSRSLPVADDHSDEDTLFPVAPWVNPSPMSGDDALKLLDEIRSEMPPQSSRTADLVREDRRR